MTPFRKYAISFLLLLNALPFLMSFLFSLHQLWIRHEMLEKLEIENLHHITVNLKNLHWEEEGKELMIGGRMFDVNSMTIIGDKAILKGLFDDEETRLFNQIEYWHKDGDDEQLLSKLDQFFQLWQGEKPMNQMPSINASCSFVKHTLFPISLPPLPEKKGQLQPPDFMES